MSFEYNWQSAFELAKGGDRTLLDEHVRNIYHDKLLPMFSAKAQSKEVAAEICTAVITKFWEKFYVNQHTLPGNVNGYIFVMAKNALLHHNKVRDKQRKQMSSLEEINLVSAMAGKLDIQEHERDDEKERMYQALNIAYNQLGERCKELLKQNIIDKKTIRSIAPLMDFPSENAATQKKVSCIKKLRKLIFAELQNPSKK